MFYRIVSSIVYKYLALTIIYECFVPFFSVLRIYARILRPKVRQYASSKRNAANEIEMPTLRTTKAPVKFLRESLRFSP